MIFILIIFLQLATCVSEDGFDFDCDFDVLPEISFDHSEQVYVVRNHWSNIEWNKEFTLKNMNLTIGHKHVPHMKPFNYPDDFGRMRFSEFLVKHILAYEHKPLADRSTDPDRMLFPFENYPGPTIFPSLTDGHSCEHIEEYALKVKKDYFVGAKGIGANFHQHREIFHQLVSGKKLFLILDDYNTLNGIHGPTAIMVSQKIPDLVKLDGVKVCQLEPGDIIHIPRDTIHATFNLETSISSGCIATQ